MCYNKNLLIQEIWQIKAIIFLIESPCQTSEFSHHSQHALLPLNSGTCICCHHKSYSSHTNLQTRNCMSPGNISKFKFNCNIVQQSWQQNVFVLYFPLFAFVYQLFTMFWSTSMYLLDQSHSALHFLSSDVLKSLENHSQDYINSTYLITKFMPYNLG